MTKQFFMVVAGLAVLSLGGCSGKSDVLATINGEEVTLNKYREYLENKSEVAVQLPNGQVGNARVYGSLGLQGLQDLIRQRVLLQLAKKENVFPTAQDIEKELAFQKERDPNFIKTLTNTMGMKMGEIKERLTLMLATERLLTKGITVTESEVDEYIKKNPKEFIQPATAELRWILVNSEDRKALVDKELRSQQTFGVVASRFSEDPNAKSRNGSLGIQVIDMLSEDIRNAIKATPEGNRTPWIKNKNSYAMFYVEKKSPEKSVQITSPIKETVRRSIARERGAKANDLDARVVEEVKNGKITVVYEPLKDKWNQALEALKAQTPGAKPLERAATESTTTQAVK